jgi:putative hydrolase of the HAD superfamily
VPAFAESVPSRVRNVVFDFGGVLVRWQPQQIIDAFYHDPHLRERLRQEVFQHPDWLEMDRGTLAEAAALERFAERLNRPRAELVRLLDRVRESLAPIPDSIALLRALERRGVPLYGLSNISVENFAYLRARDAHWGLFRGIVISAEVKMVKPEARIFEHLCREHDLAPAETVFIDDLPANIDAADRMGFRTVLFRDAAQCAAELETLLVR